MTEIPTATNLPPAPPYDGYDEPEFVPRPRRRAEPLTYVLAAAMLIGAGFLGGVLLQKHEDKGTSSASSNAAARSTFANRTGATGTGTGATGGGTGRGGFGGGAVTGTVKFVDPNGSIYVTEASGNIVKVTTSDTSSISKLASAGTTQIAPGDTLIVRGTTQSNGDVSATSVIDTPAGSSGLGFGLGAGGGGAAATGSGG